MSDPSVTNSIQGILSEHSYKIGLLISKIQFSKPRHCVEPERRLGACEVGVKADKEKKNYVGSRKSAVGDRKGIRP